VRVPAIRLPTQKSVHRHDLLRISITRANSVTGKLPQVITLASESSSAASYDNHPIANINDHVVRISVMTQPYHWHLHPNSDETFLVVEGRLKIEFESGALELEPGQMVTVPRGVRHRTSPVGDRSVNITFEAANAETIAISS
jgi:mannose-6-phosphate isomerase-like protein (cupin superfamily)